MEFAHPAIVVLIAVIVWWLSTGLVLAMVHRTERGGWGPGQVMPVMTLFGGAGIGLMWFGAGEVTPLGSYAGFFGALLVWAWHEAAFLTGVLMGGRAGECPPSLAGFARFRAAWEAICDHEIAILITGFALWFALADRPNLFGLAAFGLLWGMRISAKLLIFFGAPNAVSELMPRRIAHLKSYFKTDRLTPLFYLLMAGAVSLFILLVFWAHRATEDHSVVGHSLLATFMALAILEHLVLVLPVSDTALWRWAVPGRVKHATDKQP
ncbi:putative photosynthetic complex assembly protein PuhE [Niveispirillum sp. BGYR6]|uniref:putative photosynthetic complex assembly protein PuhE n=1 Tax=Niveispirillum sp. BGYR6 TaxID=2971249 RepID=UPI0022B9B17E|nr:putative photosynthetic complex assembly protein PuhE [Niveispirillum sp. BGYR6]MDG5493313.1 putative photosynthetic complex assembly protein PuhE [Niveispirillum sp. BGYR6]